jgi:hypothetical protein
MNNVRLESWTNAIVFNVLAAYGNVEHCYFHNVSCLTYEAAVTMSVALGQPATAPTWIAECWFAQCEFEPGSGFTEYTGAGVVINGTDEHGIIDQIRFVDCYSCLWAGPGLEIGGGTNVEILGGYYSCNGNNGGGEGPETYSKSGIAVSGGCEGLRISNAACNNSVWNVYSPAGPANMSQEYGIYVGGGSSSVRLHGCDMTGNKTSGLYVDGTTPDLSNVFAKHCDFTGLSTPLKVTTPVSNLQVVDCPGYNDSQTAAVTATPPVSGHVFHASDYGYYGPTTIYIVVNTIVTAVKINGVTTGLKQGTFVMTAGQSAEVDYGGVTPPGFVMIGQ